MEDKMAQQNICWLQHLSQPFGVCTTLPRWNGMVISSGCSEHRTSTV